MTECTDIERFFQRSLEAASTRLDGQAFLDLEALIEQGRGLYRDATAHGRKMLREQGELPIIDVVWVDDNHAAVEAFSMPLLPIVSEEDSRRFAEYRYLLAAWHVELAAFWRQVHERSDHESQG
jgi:hypothetical protein